MDQLSSRFLAAFNAVEHWMRHEFGAAEEAEFGSLLRELGPAHPGVGGRR